jgi:hypothetical protein
MVNEAFTPGLNLKDGPVPELVSGPYPRNIGMRIRSGFSVGKLSNFAESLARLRRGIPDTMAH